MSKGSAIVGFILCFFAGMGLMWGIDRGAGHGHGDTEITAEGVSNPAEWSDAAAAVPIDSKDPVWGSRTAPVTIVVYSDYQCPYCVRAEATLNALKKKYGPEKLRMVFKNNPLPFHKKATPAHEAGDVVFQLGGSDAFWKFHDLAFQNAKALDATNFKGWAEQSGVDGAKFQAAFDAGKGKAKVQADLASGKKVGVRGTPAFFINGVFISGAQPQPKFEAEIDKQLAEAKKLLAAGTKPDKIYTQLTNKNKAKTPAAADKGKKKGGRDRDTKTVWKVKIPEGAAVKGPEHALVTIVEFSEYQCPFCSRVLPTINQILDTYKGKVRVVFLDNPLPFHKRATPASMLAHEAKAQKGHKGYWAAHDLLFANQKKLEDADLWGYAEQLGLDVSKVKAAVEGNTHKAKINAFQELASDLNASGTPHFFVNGRRIVGAQPFDKFKELIDEEIKKSEALVKKGTPLAKLYDEIIKNGKEPPPPEKKDVGPAPAGAPFKGGAAAKVVIQEFSDFQCPFCSRVNGTIKQIQDTYGDKVKIVWRHKPLPFHKDAPLAHQATVEAHKQKGNKGFWDMHDKLFANQKALKREDLDKYAGELGLDMAKFKAALDGQVHKALVDKDNADSTKAGISGTPGFVINGYFLSGAQPFPKFKKLIDRAMKEAK